MTDNDKTIHIVHSKKDNRSIKPITALGALVRKKRLELGLSQQELAAQMNVQAHYISNIETGTTKKVGEKNLKKFAEHLQCEVKELITDVPQSRNPLETYIQARCAELFASQKEFARRTGLSEGTIYKCLRIGCIPAKLLEPFALALQCEKEMLQTFIQVKPTKRSGNIPDSPLGKFLQETREERGLTLRQVGISIGVTHERIRQIEASGHVSLSRLQRLAILYNIDLQDLTALQTTSNKRKIPNRHTEKKSSPLVLWFYKQRVEKEMTQKALGIKMGYTSGVHVSMFEREKSIPTLTFVTDLAKALDVVIPKELLVHAHGGIHKSATTPMQTLKIPWYLILEKMRTWKTKGWTFETVDPDGERYAIEIDLT